MSGFFSNHMDVGRQMRSVPRVWLASAACAAAAWAGGSGALAQAADETPPEIIAAHIRMQGYACEKPLSAERDRAHSKPDQPTWLLKCLDHTYLVRLIPDMAAEVRRLD
jgi:hypothetical protein